MAKSYEDETDYLLEVFDDLYTACVLADDDPSKVDFLEDNTCVVFKDESLFDAKNGWTYNIPPPAQDPDYGHMGNLEFNYYLNEDGDTVEWYGAKMDDEPLVLSQAQADVLLRVFEFLQEDGEFNDY